MRSDWMFWLVSFIPASVNMERARVRTAGNQTYETEEKNSCVYAVQSLSLVWLFATPGLQYTSLPLPSLSPRVCSNSCPLSWWCHPTISSSVIPFSSWPQSHPASGSFQMSQLFTSGGQSIGFSASASVLSMNIQGWFLLGWIGLISLQSKGLPTLFQHHKFESISSLMLSLL